MHPSFAISVTDKKKSRCKCLSCGFGGDLMDLLMDIQYHLKKEHYPGYNILRAAQIVNAEFEDMELSPEDIPDYDAPVEKTEIVFPETWLASFKPIKMFPEAVQYCVGRMITSKTMDALDLRFDPVQRRVCFPFRNSKGDLMGLQGRTIDEGTALRYYQYGYKGKRNSHVWMGEDNLNLDKPVVLLEGPFDFTSVYRVYRNVAASFTSGLSFTKVRRISDATEIITFYDHGKGGDSARESIDKMLKGYPITHIIPTEQEGDAGNMSLQAVATYLQPHVKAYLE